MKRGSILIFSLWIMILLAMFAASVGFRSRLGIRLSAFQNSAQASHFQFQSMINLASFLIAKDEDPLSDSGQDPWYGNPKEFENFGYASDYTLKIEDEESKLNLNKSTEVILQNFLKVLSEHDVKLKTKSSDLIGSVITWRGGSSIQGKAAVGFQHKRAPFETVDELRLIQHIDSGDVELLRPYLTVYGRPFDFSLKVNVNTVHDWILEAVIQSLSGGDSQKTLLLNQIQLYRKGDPNDPKNHPPFTFVAADLAPGTFIQKLKLSNSPEMVAMVSQLMQFLLVDSQFFRVLVVTKEGLPYRKAVEAVLGLRQQILVKSSKGNYSLQPRLNNVLNGYPFEVLDWNEKQVLE